MMSSENDVTRPLFSPKQFPTQNTDNSLWFGFFLVGVFRRS